MAKGLKTGGRQKGTPNKTTALLKDAILEAAELAGGKDGLVGYLKIQATANPGPFMSLLGKVLPQQLTGSDGLPLIPDSELTEDAKDRLARQIVFLLTSAPSTASAVAQAANPLH